MTGGIRVLLADDSEDDATLILRELGRTHRVEHRRVHSAEGMRAALAHPVDIIICDYAMPGFGAPQALKLVRELAADVPFVVVSGAIGEDAAVELLSAGVDDFLLKGRLGRLGSAVDHALAAAREKRARAHAEAALRESEMRFRTLVDSMDDVVFTLDSALRHDGIFGRGLESAGFSADGFLGRNALQVLGETAGALHMEEARLCLQGQRRNYEWTAEVQGEVRHYSSSLSPRREASGAISGVVGIARDVTAERRAQARLAATDRLASVGALSAAIAHEINNPLAAMVANVELVVRDLQNASPEVLRNVGGALDDALEAGRRIMTIVGDVRMLSRAPDATLVPVDVQQVLESSLRLAANQLRQRATVERHYRPVPPVLGSVSRLGQVFLNLVVNAIQALPDEAGAPQRIALSTDTDAQGRAVVTVRDSGCGMAPHQLQRLFTPFFTTKPEGTGLGLSMVHSMVTAMGGSIHVVSAPGQGATFTVVLPPAPPEAVRGPRPPSSPPPSTSPGHADGAKARLLLVDDDPLVLKALMRVLSGTYQTVAVARAHEALQRINAGERFDVILCDLMMPEMTGMDLYRALHKVAPGVAASMVFLTGGAFTQDARTFLAGVPNTRIDKPFDVDALRAAVARALRRPGTEASPS